MSIDLNYGRRTGTTTYKTTLKEFCETLRKYEAPIRAWIAASSLSASDQALLVAVIVAVDAACGVIDKIPAL